MIDLRPIHRLTFLLPPTAEASSEVILATLESLSAAIFHAAFPMRQAQAEAWVKSHPEPKPLSTTDLLSQLGLSKPVEKIQRRAYQ